MTRDEAIATLKGGGHAYIAWNNERDEPSWNPAWGITLDGEFTKEELLAILFFHPGAHHD